MNVVKSRCGVFVWVYCTKRDIVTIVISKKIMIIHPDTKKKTNKQIQLIVFY